MINTEHPRTVAQRSRCLWTIRTNGSLWLPAFTKALNIIVIKLHPAQGKNRLLLRYQAIIVLSVKVARRCKNSTSASPARKQSKVRVKSGRRGAEEPRKPACTLAEKSKGVPGEAPGWLHRLECLLQSRLKARLIWLRRCHWWFLRGLECSPAKSRSHPRSSREKREKRFVIPLNANAGHLRSRGKQSPFADLVEWT